MSCHSFSAARESNRMLQVVEKVCDYTMTCTRGFPSFFYGFHSSSGSLKKYFHRSALLWPRFSSFAIRFALSIFIPITNKQHAAFTISGHKVPSTVAYSGHWLRMDGFPHESPVCYETIMQYFLGNSFRF